MRIIYDRLLVPVWCGWSNSDAIGIDSVHSPSFRSTITPRSVKGFRFKVYTSTVFIRVAETIGFLFVHELLFLLRSELSVIGILICNVFVLLSVFVIVVRVRVCWVLICLIPNKSNYQ